VPEAHMPLSNWKQMEAIIFVLEMAWR